MPILGSILIPLFSEAKLAPMAVIIALVVVVIVFHHAIAVAIAHLFHPHVLGIVLGIAAVALLLAVLAGFWAVPATQPNAVAVVGGIDAHAAVDAGGNSPTWMKLFFFAAVVAAIVAITLALSGRLKLHFNFTPGIVVLLVIGVAVLLLVSVRAQRESFVRSQMATAHDQQSFMRDFMNPWRQPEFQPAIPAMPAPPVITSPEMTVHDGPVVVAAADKKPKSGDSTPEDNASHDNVKPTQAAAPNPPAWVNEPEHRQGDSWFVVVSVKEDTGPTLREDMFDETLVDAAKQYIDVRWRPGSDVSNYVHTVVDSPLDDAGKQWRDYLRLSTVRDLYPSAGTAAVGQVVYARLEFGKKFRDEVQHRYRQFASQSRLEQTANIAIVALLTLGGTYSYLRLTGKKKDDAVPA